MRRHLVARPRVWLAVGAVLAVAAADLGCASTRITSTWRDPGVGAVQFRKVVGVALARDATLRRLAEDEFVRALGPGAALAGYAVIPDEEVEDRDKARTRVEAAGADGVAVFRLVGVETEQRWVPPTYYGHAWGYWGMAAPVVYDPGYLQTDRIVQVETTVYRVADARLVWATRSETFNPESAEDLIAGVVRAVVDAMREEALVAGAPGG
jgi:hypothetical protein